MLNKRGKLANTFTLVFSSIGFLLALKALFTIGSGITQTGTAWILALITLFAVIFTVAQYKTRSHVPLVLNVITSITVALIATFCGLYWLLVCMVLCLIGIIIYRGSKIR